MKVPVLGDIWIKYQVAQFSRVLSTLLTGGIPLVQGLETSADSLGTPLLRKTLSKAARWCGKARRFRSPWPPPASFPPLSVDMIEVGESTGALPSMLSSVAEFYEDDVNTKMTAVLSLIEPAIMIFMGMFVAFVLIALYLPIFSLADTIK
jgi:type IV pilus assembly protein PilC